MKKLFKYLVALIVFIGTLLGCSIADEQDEATKPASLVGKPLEPGFASNDMVMYWNEKTEAVLSAGMPQPYRTRNFAMIEIAVHDALNNIKPKFKRYALMERDQHANPNAAVASAAYWTLKGLNLGANLPLDDWYNESLATIPECESKDQGVLLGKHSADAIIANRANDGFSQLILNSITPANGVNPGEYRSTHVAMNWIPTENQLPFRILHNWGTVMKPYVLQSNQQFRPSGPYQVNSPEYTSDFNEVKNKGARVGSTRTAEEAKLAFFWSENRQSIIWNMIVRKAIENKKLDAWKTARLFALIHVTMAEDINAYFDATYHYYFWRPETAIQWAETDGNSDTEADPSWFPQLAENANSTSPPIPAYPSIQASYGGSVAELLHQLLESDDTSIDITTTSTNPGVPNPKPSFHFSSFDQIAEDNSNSWIYLGWDFRKSATDGQEMGKQIASYIYTHHFNEE